MEPAVQNSSPEKPRRGFRPGVSGNPGGRPKAVKALVEKVRKLTPKAIKVLDAALDSEDERVRMTAVHEVLDRGWGKAPQAIEHSGPSGESIAININLGSGNAK